MNRFKRLKAEVSLHVKNTINVAGVPTGRSLARSPPAATRMVAGVPTGRSLARSPPAATGMVARLSDNLQLLAPVLRFYLQASSKRTHAYTTRSHKTPPVGVQSQGTHNQQFTRPDAGNKTLACKNYYRTIQVRTTFDPSELRLI